MSETTSHHGADPRNVADGSSVSPQGHERSADGGGLSDSIREALDEVEAGLAAVASIRVHAARRDGSGQRARVAAGTTDGQDQCGSPSAGDAIAEIDDGVRRLTRLLERAPSGTASKRP